MNSGRKISISSWMDYLSIFCRCLILVLTAIFCSINVSLKRRVGVVCWFVLPFA